MNITRPLRIGKYEILSELGRGATAVVYLADDTFNDRKVAIKVQVKDESAGPEESRRFEKLFLNEAAMVGKLSHPNIVGVFDAVVEGEQQYIVMEYVGGGSLKKFCTETNLLPLRQAVLVIFKACRALDYAFQNGVIHRDIKAANILLSDREDIKISDFGTAQISHSTHTQIDGFVGSPAYMAPEQINEEPPSVQTDIYSLGVTMYELLTGRLPFQATNSVAMINKILNEDPTPIQSIRPDLPEALVAIVNKSMAKDPEQRYPAWYAMARDLADTFPQLEKYSFEISSAEKFNSLRKLEFFKDFRDSELWEVLRGALWESHGRVFHHRCRAGKGDERQQAPQCAERRRLLWRDGVSLGQQSAPHR
jgi:eukaryotic-like serine/threonine-protein kinase